MYSDLTNTELAKRLAEIKIGNAYLIDNTLMSEIHHRLQSHPANHYLDAFDKINDGIQQLLTSWYDNIDTR